MADPRIPRAVETRENTSRIESWRPPDVLPTPEPQNGWSFRWIRTSVVGQADVPNVSMRQREGWTPVKADDHPELKVVRDHGSRFPENIEVGGLLLCKMPTEKVESRRRYMDGHTDQQMVSIDSQLLKDQDARMPIIRERRTHVSIGPNE
jgi:hypothetical protein